MPGLKNLHASRKKPVTQRPCSAIDVIQATVFSYFGYNVIKPTPSRSGVSWQSEQQDISLRIGGAQIIDDSIHSLEAQPIALL